MLANLSLGNVAPTYKATAKPRVYLNLALTNSVGRCAMRHKFGQNGSEQSGAAAEQSFQASWA
jgi:hypothetical protein